MGAPLDPSDVQDLIEAWEREAHPYLEEERNRYRKLAEDALNVRPTPTYFVCQKCGFHGPITEQAILKHRGELKCDGATTGVAEVPDER